MCKILPALQDAVILARKVHDLLHPQSESKGARPTTLRSVATADLVQVLRDYEKERKNRTRLITIRSNLMGQALQIRFAPVSSLMAHLSANSTTSKGLIWFLHQKLLLSVPCCSWLNLIKAFLLDLK